MSFEVSHVLVDVDDFVLVLLHLQHERVNELGKVWIALPNGCFITLELAANMCEELLEML